MKCKRHPKYTGKRKPRVDCMMCWEIWHDKDRTHDHNPDICTYCGEEITSSLSRHRASEPHGLEKWRKEVGDYDSW